MPGTPAFDVAVVGAGMGSAPHLRSLQDLRATYPLTWVCARDAQRLAAVPLPEGVRRTTRLDDILQDPRVRAVRQRRRRRRIWTWCGWWPQPANMCWSKSRSNSTWRARKNLSPAAKRPACSWR